MSFLGEKKHPATVFSQILQAIWLLLNLYKLIIVCALKCFGLIRFFFSFLCPQSNTLGRIAFSKIMVDLFIWFSQRHFINSKTKDIKFLISKKFKLTIMAIGGDWKPSGQLIYQNNLLPSPGNMKTKKISERCVISRLLIQTQVLSHALSSVSLFFFFFFLFF